MAAADTETRTVTLVGGPANGMIIPHEQPFFEVVTDAGGLRSVLYRRERFVARECLLFVPGARIVEGSSTTDAWATVADIWALPARHSQIERAAVTMNAARARWLRGEIPTAEYARTVDELVELLHPDPEDDGDDDH